MEPQSDLRNILPPRHLVLIPTTLMAGISQSHPLLKAALRTIAMYVAQCNQTIWLGLRLRLRGSTCEVVTDHPGGMLVVVVIVTSGDSDNSHTNYLSPLTIRYIEILKSRAVSQPNKVKCGAMRYSGVRSALQVNMYKDKRLTFLILIYSVTVEEL